MLISIGTRCKVRGSFNKFTKQTSSTNLFDWNISSFKAVLYVLKNIHVPFIKEDFEEINSGEPEYPSRFINHTNNKINFLSIHDVSKNRNYDEEMTAFLAKYNRRKDRLSIIISNYKHTIHFIYFITIDNDTSEILEDDMPSAVEISEFHENIQTLNPNCKYKLHILIHPNYYNKTDKFNHLLVENTNTYVHFMKRLYYIDNVVEENMDGYNWNWAEIYDGLLNNT